MNIYGYVRVSSTDQNEDRQILAMRENSVLEKNKKGKIEVRTAHSLNPVPFIIYDKDERHEMKEGAFGLANVAPTVVGLMGIKPYDSWEESMLK